MKRNDSSEGVVQATFDDVESVNERYKERLFGKYLDKLAKRLIVGYIIACAVWCGLIIWFIW